MSGIGVLLKKEIMEQFRSKKALIIVVIFLFTALASPLGAKFTPELLKSLSEKEGVTISMPDPTHNDAVDQFVKNMGQLVSFFLIFVVAGAIVDEKTRKTLELVLVKPVSRSSFILSKFLGYFTTVTVFYAAAVMVFYIYTMTIFGSFDPSNLFILSALLLPYLYSILAVTILASTVVKSAAAAGGIGFLCVLLFGTLLGLFPVASDYYPGYVLSNYGKLMLDGWDMAFVPPAITAILIAVMSMFLSVFAFQKQEIER